MFFHFSHPMPFFIVDWLYVQTYPNILLLSFLIMNQLAWKLTSENEQELRGNVQHIRPALRPSFHYKKNGRMSSGEAGSSKSVDCVMPLAAKNYQTKKRLFCFLHFSQLFLYCYKIVTFCSALLHFYLNIRINLNCCYFSIVVCMNVCSVCIVVSTQRCNGVYCRYSSSIPLDLTAFSIFSE